VRGELEPLDPLAMPSGGSGGRLDGMAGGMGCPDEASADSSSRTRERRAVISASSLRGRTSAGVIRYESAKKMWKSGRCRGRFAEESEEGSSETSQGMQEPRCVSGERGDKIRKCA